MDEHGEILRRRVALYRAILAQGADIVLAREYLLAILAAEFELQRLENCHLKLAGGEG